MCKHWLTSHTVNMQPASWSKYQRMDFSVHGVFSAKTNCSY